MKKLLVIAILMLALVFVIVACDKTPETTDTTVADTTAETPTEAPSEDAEETTEAPTEETPTDPAEETTEAPTEEEPTDAPTEEPTEAVTEPTVTLDKTEYQLGESIMISATGSGKDWVGIAVAGGSESIRWWYVADVGEGVAIDALNDSHIQPGTGAATGALPAGEYEVVWVANDQSLAGADKAYRYKFTVVDPSEPVLMLDPDTLNTLSGAGAPNVSQIGTPEILTEGNKTFIRLTAAGGDPYVAIIPLNSSYVLPNYMAISYRTNSAVEGQFFMGSGAGWSGNGDSFMVTWTEGDWSFVIVDLSQTGVTSVTDNKYTYLRMDFFAGNSAEGDYYDIQYIGFFNTAEYAADYDFKVNPPYIEMDNADAGKKGNSFDTFYVNNEMYFPDGSADAKLDEINNTITFDVGEAHESLALRGWIGFDQAIDQFGYFIDDPRAQVFDEFKQATEDGVLAAGGEFASRFQINVPLTDLEGVHTIGFVVKLEDGTVVRLRKNLTVVVVPYHEDKTIVLGDRGNGTTPICSPNEKKVGQKINVTEGFLKQITVAEMATYGDSGENTWTFKVWQWNGDYATTVATAPLYEISGENHMDCHSMIIDIPATLMLSGEIYYEAEYLSGIGGFTGWIAEGYVAEGHESYVAGVQTAVHFASSIRVGIPTPEGVIKTVIDLSAVTSTGNYPTVDTPIPGSLFGTAHCYALHYGSINLGEMDLSQYSKVTIAYSTPDDATVPTASAEYNMTGKRVLLLNAPSAAEGTFEYLPEESAIITSTQYERSPASLIPTTVEIDLSEITYNGDVYLTFDFRDPNNGVAVNAYVVWVIDITFS